LNVRKGKGILVGNGTKEGVKPGETCRLMTSDGNDDDFLFFYFDVIHSSLYPEEGK
jgi:hypothetical protein